MSGVRARLFVALELPGEVRSALTSWRAGVLNATPSLRPVPADSLHVTLCFLGALPAEAVGEIGQVCAKTVADRSRGEIPLSLGDGLWLPPRRPRVLTVEIDDPNRDLAAVQGGLSEALARGGWYEPESRPFLAHATVARAARGKRIRPLDLPIVDPLPFPGATVTLYRSRPGSRYEPLLRAPL